jgi:hypothetical protein
MKKPAAKLPMTMSKRIMSCSRMITQKTMRRRTWSTIVSTIKGDRGILFQVVDTKA